MSDVDSPRAGSYFAAGAAGVVSGVVASASAWALYRAAHGCLRPAEACRQVSLNTAIMAGVGAVLVAIIAGLISASLLRAPLPLLLATLGLSTVALFLWLPLQFRRFDDSWLWTVGLAGLVYGVIAAVCVPETPKQVRLAGLAILVADAVYVFAVPR